MILFWVTLLFFHHGYTLVPLFTVQLGEPATFTCRLPEDQDSRVKIHWYKQNAGDTLKIIVSLWKLAKPEYGPEYSASRLKVTLEEKFSNLTIVRTVKEDEGMYHCAFNDWSKNIWHSMYLSLKGPTERTSDYTVVQQTAASDPDGSRGSVTLQCSLLSGSDIKTCSGGLRVFWFRVRSEKSYPDMIYTQGKRHDECEKKPDSQNRCVFFRNISSTDAGTFYCAVATCGQILFGNEPKVQGSSSWSDQRTCYFLLSAVLAISLIIIAVLIRSNNNCLHCKAVNKPQLHNSGLKIQQTGEHEWIYSAAIFTPVKADSRAMKAAAKKQKIYAAVKLLD